MRRIGLQISKKGGEIQKKINVLVTLFRVTIGES